MSKKASRTEQLHQQIANLDNLARASVSDVTVIYGAFQTRKDVFPHVRSDYVHRACEQGRCIYDSGIVIIWQQYVKTVRLGSVTIPKGSVMLHQILNTTDARETAADVFKRFCELVKGLGPIYLSVRESNARARRFYEKHGMTPAGRIAWSGGKIPGLIYCYQEKKICCE